MNRTINFSAGPSALPLPVLERAARELVVHGDDGMSVMEMSHRTPMFEKIIYNAEGLLRELMGIPESYSVLFLQGGASLQFAMVPLNLMTGSGRADFALTGMWAERAFAEAKKFGTAQSVGSSADKIYNYIPSLNPSDFDSGADYFHICHNNTIYGTRFSSLPDTGSVPLVADMSSSILSQKIDVSRFDLIYAGAQKNMGPAGLTVVIIKKDLIKEPLPNTPTMLRYDTHYQSGSMYNTPPTYPIYMCMLVLEWLKSLGGLGAMEERNEQKAHILYSYLDKSGLFKATVTGADRSIMNIPFVTGDKKIDAQFTEKAAKAGFVNLQGHRSVGGMRASLYNALSPDDAAALVHFMAEFEKEQKRA